MPQGRDRARSQGAGRSRGAGPAGLRQGGRAGQGRARGLITSASNPRLKLVRRLHARRGRERLGLFACEGEDLVGAALDAGLEPVEVLVDAARPALLDRFPSAEHVEPGLLAATAVLAHPPRVIGVFRRADLPRLAAESAPPPVGVGLWRLTDPGNVGAVVRSADALGPAFVCLSPGTADPTGPKALRASMGAIFRVPLGGLDAAPRPWIGLVPTGGRPLADLERPRRATFLLGAERAGLPPEVLAACDERATIPQAAGAESLNVAAAAAIALYEWGRRRAGEG